MKEKIEALRSKAKSALEACDSEQAIEELRVKYLGKKGELTALLKQMGSLSAEERPVVGQLVNEAKQKLEALIAEKKAEMKQKATEAKLKAETIDITMPAKEVKTGGIHPLNHVVNDMIDIFQSMGFDVVDGPEVETDHYNFECLNVPADHPARDMQDTFFVEANPEHVQGNVILRTHTSSVQSRVMESTQPPIRIICPGRVYRNEAISYRAHAFFHQVEALYIDKNVSFTDLKQVLLLFAKEMFGAETQIRLRPSYFPFTEPSAEMDISCNICGGKGCPFCKGTGWVEILGCGMVDPNVLEANGIDSKVYSGYALGMGIERITNLKYRVNDLRLFSENDTRFLKEFEAAN